MTMNAGKDALKNPLRRVPDFRLSRVTSGDPVFVRARGRVSSVLLFRHDSSCRECETYEDQLSRRAVDITDWDGRVLAVLADAEAAAEPSLSEMPPLLVTVVDHDSRLAAALHVEVPALVITDQWGEIHLAENGGAEHRFPPADEVVSWLRYLAIQCPECQGEAF